MVSTKKAERVVDTRVPAKVRQILCETLGIDDPEVTADSRLVEDLGADPLDLVELAIRFEKYYGISELEEQGAEDWGDGSSVADVLATLTKAGATL